MNILSVKACCTNLKEIAGEYLWVAKVKEKYLWAQGYAEPKESSVMLILNMENHLKDGELFVLQRQG